MYFDRGRGRRVLSGSKEGGEAMATTSSIPSLDAQDLAKLLGSSTTKGDEVPVSATELASLVRSMGLRSDHIRGHVADCLHSRLPQFRASVARASASAALFHSASSRLEDTLALLEDEFPPAVDGRIKGLLRDVHEAKCQLEEKRCAAAAVGRIADLYGVIVDAHAEIEGGELVKAAASLGMVRRALGISKEWIRDDRIKEEGVGIKAYECVKDSWEASFTKLRGHLEQLFLKVIEVDEENKKLSIIPCLAAGATDDLHNILTSMDEMEILGITFAKFTDILFRSIITPLLCNPLEFKISEGHDHSLDRSERHFLSLIANPAKEGSLQNTVILSSLYKEVLKAIRFLRQHLCCGHEKWMEKLSQMAWPRLAEAIIANHLSKAIPNDSSEIVNFQKLATITEEFYSALADIDFVHDASFHDNSLGGFVSEVEVHFAQKRKKRILAKARRFLAQSDFALPLSSGGISKETSTEYSQNSEDNSVMLLFKSEACTVSWAAKQLMQIVHETLQEACITTSKVAIELYHTARDCLSLYRAIVPVKLAKELGSLSCEAVIYHNDCLYLASEVLGLSYQYGGAVPDELQTSFVFMDLALMFQQMAEEQLTHQIDILKSKLNEAIDNGNGFQSTHTKAGYEIASSAIEQAILVLHNARMLWEQTMPHSVFREAISYLLNLVSEQFACKIIALDDIEIQETVELCGLIRVLEEKLTPLLQIILGDVSKGQDKIAVSKYQGSWNEAKARVPAWCKLKRLAEFLELPLRPITHAWESGNLANCGFSAAEVQKLIKAIFSDSELRKECLLRITETESQ